MKTKTYLSVAAFALLVTGCNTKQGTTMVSGIGVENLDTTVTPGTDFFRYACGGWMDNHPLKDEYSRYGSFEALNELCTEQLKTLVGEIASQQHEAGSIEQKIGDLYNIVMDSVKQNREGIEPIKNDLARIAAIKDNSEILPLMAEMSMKGMEQYFGMYISADTKDSKNNLVCIFQSGLSLGEKEYYTDNDTATVDIRHKYKDHIVTMFKKVGFSEEEALKKMEAVFEIETRMASKFYSAVERRDPEANYHKMSYDDLKKNYPGIDWDVYFNTFGITDLKELSVDQPEPLKEAEAILTTVPVEKQKAFLEWKLISNSANYLSDELRQESFNFFGKVLSGRKEMRSRWKRAIGIVDGSLGDAVGEMYVAKYFPAAAKERMINLVKNLQTALGERIMAQEWMSDSTKTAAIEKLNTFYVKVGYPDKWKDYSSLEIKDDSYLANIQRISEWEIKDMIARRYNKPVDRDEWYMNPQTVNAYYNPSTNEICFPAGILQPPFFDMNADDAFNYGAIGVVIGHEMTHGFDDQGRRFDKEGNLKDWWTVEDGERFNTRAKVMEDFFSNIEVLPGLKGNGKLTLGENLADHGGLMVSFQAFKNATENAPLGDIDGFTPEQRFFLAYANVWAGNIRNEEIRRRTKSDPHALGKWRVNGALPHIDAWYEAFNITENDSLFVPKEQRVTIW